MALRSPLAILIEFAGRKFAEEFGAGNATRPNAVSTLLGLGHSEAARAGGKSRDDTFSDCADGDHPFVSADVLKLFHAEPFATKGQRKNVA